MAKRTNHTNKATDKTAKKATITHSVKMGPHCARCPKCDDAIQNDNFDALLANLHEHVQKHHAGQELAITIARRGTLAFRASEAPTA